MMGRQFVIALGIAIILPMLVHFGVKSFMPEPRFQDYVQNLPFRPNMTSDERAARDAKVKEQRAAYNRAATRFGNVVVLVATPIGVAAIIVGALIGMQAVGTGLILGGTLSLIWGYWAFGTSPSDQLRFVSLLTGFASLLFVGYRHMQQSRKST